MPARLEACAGALTVVRRCAPHADVTVRDACGADVPALARVRYAEHPAIHRDRIGDAVLGYVRYLVAEREGTVVGFSLLVFKNPSVWASAGPIESTTDNTGDFLPQAVDLYVAEAQRSQGVGRRLIAYVENVALGEGYDRLFLSVDPKDNGAARGLYLRLGFVPLQTEPRWNEWRSMDSDGHVHAGSGWMIDMVRPLGRGGGRLGFADHRQAGTR
jgi:GNAT superfamily N-acetyltransferase